MQQHMRKLWRYAWMSFANAKRAVAEYKIIKLCRNNKIYMRIHIYIYACLWKKYYIFIPI